MKWSLLELRKYQDVPLAFREKLDLEASLKKRDHSIMHVAPVEVEGTIAVDAKDYLVQYRLQTILTVPSSRSLEPVELSLNIEVVEVFMTADQYQKLDDRAEADEILIIEGNQINLLESVEDNILLAIPMQILSETEEQATELPKGTDWEVLSEDDYQRRQVEEAETKVDPRLAKLSTFFDDKSENNDDA